MRKVQFMAVFWTLLIAVPITALALTMSAYLTNHLIDLSNGVSSLVQRVFSQGRDLIFEAEVAGLIAGQLLILAILLITLLPRRSDHSVE
ncbi:MAG: hypothetical protein PHS96_09705 [Anaerolineales bacterium]|nr:hypothetical protein [Anaerolineales bacterium]